MDRAKCGDLDTDKWYPPRGGGVYTSIATYAKGVCLGKDGRPPCPVRVECLLDALDRDEGHGIFGGLSHRERNALMRRYQSVAYMSLEEFIISGGRG